MKWGNIINLIISCRFDYTFLNSMNEINLKCLVQIYCLKIHLMTDNFLKIYLIHLSSIKADISYNNEIYKHIITDRDVVILMIHEILQTLIIKM